MNQAQKSVVSKMSPTSEDYSVLQSICRHPVHKNISNSGDGKWETFRRVLLDVSHLLSIQPYNIHKYAFISSVLGCSALRTNASGMQIWWKRLRMHEYV